MHTPWKSPAFRKESNTCFANIAEQGVGSKNINAYGKIEELRNEKNILLNRFRKTDDVEMKEAENDVADLLGESTEKIPYASSFESSPDGTGAAKPTKTPKMRGETMKKYSKT